jgi:hypothetical protein
MVTLYDTFHCPGVYGAEIAVKELTSGLEKLKPSPENLLVRVIALLSLGKAQALGFALAPDPSQSADFKASLRATASELKKVTVDQLVSDIVNVSQRGAIRRNIESGMGQLAAADQVESKDGIFKVFSELKLDSCQK